MVIAKEEPRWKDLPHQRHTTISATLGQRKRERKHTGRKILLEYINLLLCGFSIYVHLLLLQLSSPFAFLSFSFPLLREDILHVLGSSIHVFVVCGVLEWPGSVCVGQFLTQSLLLDEDGQVGYTVISTWMRGL